MSIYTAKKIIFGIAPPTDIVCTLHMTDRFIFTWTAVEFATRYEYTTDNGLTFKECASGVAITTQSNGNPFVNLEFYTFKFRSYDGYYDDYSIWSDGITVQASNEVIPTGMTLAAYPQEKGAMLKSYVVNDGNAVNGCEAWFIIDDTEETTHFLHIFTGEIFKAFTSLIEGRHRYKVALKNNAGTSYGDEKYIIFAPGSLKMEVLKVV